ncbi:L-threonylcarbamoyladenylate synthase [Candidatus Laterigemmans baculatus]|uniref:L-threonylcarbamoyladenylate synthase n=1 Tax=Candidatus Laterigemmans baculatus TaxID=2770505 RepID=UPI0013D9690D|nr:L-threonylcarbamoyladenylate synthase [Candidatus Laterigemmans baculatus]
MSPVLSGESPQDIAQAAKILRGGGLVALPTETVYGLGADAANEHAVRRIFAAKGRPADHPLIVHLGRTADLERWAREIPPLAWRLAERFWPGPLTLILKRNPDVPAVVTGGQATIGLRVPAHPVALAVLQAAETGVAAPSANRFGRVSPTTAEHVAAELGTAVDAILDGGPCSVGLESTILDLSGNSPQILRPGAITAAAIAELIGETPGSGGASSPRVPGRLPSHYAPQTPLRLLDRQALAAAVEQLSPSDPAIAVLSMQPPPATAGQVQWLEMPEDAEAYGRRLYARLREADAAGCQSMLVERPPATPQWDAVQDRLRRAAATEPHPSPPPR